MYQLPRLPYSYFSQALEFHFRVLFFPVSILKLIQFLQHKFNADFAENQFGVTNCPLPITEKRRESRSGVYDILLTEFLTL